MQDHHHDNEDEYQDDVDEMTESRRRLIVTALVLILVCFAGLVPLLIIGARAFSLDRERNQWQQRKAERLGELQRCNDLIADKRERIQQLDAQLAEAGQRLARRQDSGGSSSATEDVDEDLLGAEKAKLEQRFQALSQEFSSALRKLHDENQEIRTLLQAKTQDAKQTAVGMDASKERIAEIEQEIAGLQNRRDALRDEFRHLTAQVKKQHDELKQTNLETSKLVELKKERADLLSSIAENRNTHQKLVEAVAKLSRERERNENRVAVFAQESRKVAEELNAITNKLQNNQAKQKELVKEIAALQERRSKLSKEVENSARQLTELQDAVAEKKALLTDLRARVDGLRVEIARRQQLHDSEASLTASGDTRFDLPEPKSVDAPAGGFKKDLAELEVKVFEAQIKSLQAEKDLLMKDVKKLQDQLRDAGTDSRHTPAGNADSI